uniref:RRM domain-containing protein n=1 Tax=Trypanosoma vivax (strain Y486) TaxID=1055687 RepID=G0TY01_TRYVY|nr:conserved hypothetical protein [Trypanosoma vivax Y486]
MSNRVCIRCPNSVSDEQALLRICSSFGDITDFSLLNSTSGSTTECAFQVEYEEAEDAVAAAGNMNGMEFDGSHLRVFVMRTGK